VKQQGINNCGLTCHIVAVLVQIMYTLQQLAEILDRQVLGDAEVVITGVSPFEQAGPGDITLAIDRKYRNHLEKTAASAVIVDSGVTTAAKPVLQVANPKLAFARTMALFHSKLFQAQSISPMAFIGKDCRIANKVSIYPFVYVGNGIEIEGGVTLHPGGWSLEMAAKSVLVASCIQTLLF
jgi:UDP-3-O-[3-hydroxymyristoyl] glucosamine N-acyltransferase